LVSDPRDPRLDVAGRNRLSGFVRNLVASVIVPGTNRRIPHELQDLILYFRALPSATASSRAVEEPGTGAEVVKDRTGPDLDERPLYIQYVTESGDCFGQIDPFLPTGRRPTVDHSLVAGGAQRQSLQACLLEAIRCNACSLLALPDFPEFAQAVSYGVPGTPEVRPAPK
jgi:hypothetical protein